MYTSRGVLCWLPDIRGWARVVAHFVKPGGIFFITEAHPIAWALDEGMPLVFRYAYWERAEPEAFDVEGSYADVSADVKTEKEYSWNHGLGEIVTALIDAGLTIELLHEYPFSAWDMGFTVEGPGRHVGEAGLRGRRAPAVLLVEGSEARVAIRSLTPPPPIAPPDVPTGGRRSRGS